MKQPILTPVNLSSSYELYMVKIYCYLTMFYAFSKSMKSHPFSNHILCTEAVVLANTYLFNVNNRKTRVR